MVERSALHLAVTLKDVAMIKVLIQHGMDLELKDEVCDMKVKEMM